MAMVGAARRLATELVVIMASATHEIHVVAGTLLRATAPAVASAALMSPHLETCERFDSWSRSSLLGPCDGEWEYHAKEDLRGGGSPSAGEIRVGSGAAGETSGTHAGPHQVEADREDEDGDDRGERLGLVAQCLNGEHQEDHHGQDDRRHQDRRPGA